MSHTPGPWKVRYGALSDSDEGFSVTSDNADDPRIVAECWPCTTTLQHRQEMQADARLIAAAPELLEACKRLCETMFQIAGGPLELVAKYGDGFVPPNEHDIEREYYRCCEAINKAEGKT